VACCWSQSTANAVAQSPLRPGFARWWRAQGAGQGQPIGLPTADKHTHLPIGGVYHVFARQHSRAARSA